MLYKKRNPELKRADLRRVPLRRESLGERSENRSVRRHGTVNAMFKRDAQLGTIFGPESVRCSCVTGKPEVIALSVGLALINVLELTGRANFRVVGYSETEPLPHGRSTAKRQTAPLLWSARNRNLNCRP